MSTLPPPLLAFLDAVARSASPAREWLLLAHELTLLGRSLFGQLDAPGSALGLLVLNELQHRLSSHVRHLLEGTRGYTDEDLLVLLRDYAARGGFAGAFDEAVAFVVEG